MGHKTTSDDTIIHLEEWMVVCYPSCQIPINRSCFNGVRIANLTSRGNRIHGSNPPDNVIQWRIANSNLLGEVQDKQVDLLVIGLILC